MSGFKVGDKVRRISGISGIGTVTAVGKHKMLVMEGGVEDRWYKSLCEVVPSIPTPPEGREVEEEMRPPKKGDVYWSDVAIPHKWQQAYDDHRFSGDKPRYCLRPLPPKPEGEGWEWRKPVEGDEYQSLRANDEPSGGLWVCANPEYLVDVRLGYRWCRAKPKVKRWTHEFLNFTIGVQVPLIDTGTGPRLDTDKIGREWAIKWLEEQHAEQVKMHWPTSANHAKNYADMLRKEQEAFNVND